MNDLVLQYRQLNPDDARSDDQITLLLGQQNAQDGRYNNSPGFLSDLQRVTQAQTPSLDPRTPSLGEELSRGVSRGVAGLKSTAYGAGALASDVVGADSLTKALTQKYREAAADEASPDLAPSVGKVEDIHGVGDAARYALGKAGEFVPNVGEAALFGAAGAAAGSAAGPEGTAAGGAGGAVEGLIARQAAKSLLRTLVEKGAAKLGMDEAAGALAKEQLEKVVSRESVGPLMDSLMDKEGKGLLASEIKSQASKFGMTVGNAANFFALGAGGEYPKLAGTDGVTDSDARTGALIAGIGSSLGAMLPTHAMSKLFPGVADTASRDYVTRLAVNAAKEIPMAATGMGLMEVANIAAERYADPAKRDLPLSDEDLSRVMNAAVTGGLMGAAVAPVASIPGPRGKGVPDAAAVAQEKARQAQADMASVRTLNASEQPLYALIDPAKKDFGIAQVVRDKFPAVTDDRLAELAAIKERMEAPAEEEISKEAPPSTTPTVEPEPVPTKANGSEAGGATTPPATPTAETKAPEPGTIEPPDATVSPSDATKPTVDETLQRKRAAAVTSIASSDDPVVAAAKARVAAAREQTHTAPSAAQKLAGNYQKGRVTGVIPGFTIAIETPKGADREGVSDGKPWRTKMASDYSQILGTKGMDGDPIDAYIGPNPTSQTAYVVDQIDPRTGKPDEHKIMVGFESKVQAEAAYDTGFSDGSGPARRGAVTAISKADLSNWLKGDTSKPFNPELIKSSRDAVVSGAKAASDKTKRLAVSEHGDSGINIPGDSGLGARAGNPPDSKGSPNRSVRNSDLARNLSAIQTSSSKGYGSLDIPSRSRVFEAVLAAIKDDEVFNSIVPTLPVDVMNLLSSKERSAESLRHDKAMLIHALSINDDLAIRSRAVDAIVRSPAFSIAEVSRIGISPEKVSATVKAGNVTHESKVTTSAEGVKSTDQKGSTNANKIESPVENVRSEAPGPAAQVAEGKPGEVREPAKPGKVEPSKSDAGKGSESGMTDDQLRAAVGLPPEKKPEIEAGVKTKPVASRAKKEEGPSAEQVARDKRHAANADKLAAIKAKLAENKSKREAEGNKFKPTTPESGFTITPEWLHKIVAPEDIPLYLDAAKTIFQDGATRFKEFASDLVAMLGDEAARAAGSLYEAIRTAHTDRNGKVFGVGKDMTPHEHMVTDVLRLHDQVFGAKEGPKIYPTDYRIRPEDVDVEGRGTKHTSARGRDSKLAAELWEKQREQEKPTAETEHTPALRDWGNLTTEEKEAFIDSLPKKTKGEIRAQEQETVEPAYFTVKSQDPADLAKRLLSDSSPPSGDYRNSATHRLVDIRNRETGAIERVSVFLNNGKAMVTKFADGIGRKNSKDRAIPLQAVLDAKTPEGKPQYHVLASLRTSGLTEYYHETFKDRADYDKNGLTDTTGATLKARQGAVQAGAEVEEAKMAQHGREVGGAAPKGAREDEEVSKAADLEQAAGVEEGKAETLPVEGAEDRATADVSGVADEKATETTAEAINLEPHEVATLADKVPEGSTIGDMADMVEDEPALKPIFKKIAQADPGFFDLVQEVGIRKALKEYGYKADERTGGQVEPRAAGQPGTDLQNAGPRGEVGSGDAAAPVEGQQNLPAPEARGPERPSQPPVAPGTGEPDRAAPKLRQPEPAAQPHDPEAARLLQSIHDAAARAGIDVQRVEGALGAGAYDPKNRTLLQVVGDTIGSQDVKTALHEVGHDVFAGETPEVRDRLLRAVDSLSDEALGVDTSADTRIRASDPAALGKEAVNEERLVEATAGKLQQEGFDPEQAKGFAQKFVRSLKDHYLRAAMAVQRMFGFQENPELARRYFENRVKQLLAGDRNSESYIDFIGARKLSGQERRGASFPSTRTTAENFDHAGTPTQEHVSDLSASGTLFNRDAMRDGWKYTLPGGDRMTRTTDIERRIAPLNHLADVIGEASKALMEREDIAKLVNKTKSKSPMEFLHKLLGIDDPLAKRDLYKDEREPDGSRVVFDPEKRPKDFAANENRDHSLLNSFSNVSDMMTEMDGHRTDAENEKTRIEKSLRNAQEDLNEKQTRVREIEEIKADKTKVVAGLDDIEKEAREELADAKGTISSLNRQMVKQKQRLSVLDAISPTIQTEYSRLAAQLEVRPDFVFRPDAWFNSPEKAETKTEDLLKPANRAQLKLNPDGRTITSQKDLMGHLQRMRAFLDHRETLARNGDENALDIGYHTVKQQRHEILARTVAGADISLDVKPTSRPGFLLSMMADGKRLMEGIGSRAARSFMRRQNEYETILAGEHNYNETMGRKTGKMENDLMALIPKAGDRDWLRINVLNPVKDALKGMHDLAEKHAGSPEALKRAQYVRLKDNLLTYDTTRAHIRPVADRFMPLLQKLIDHQWEMDQHRVAEAEKSGLGVEDTRLGKMTNLASGEQVPTTRRRLAIGSYTFSRKIGRTFSEMVKAMRQSGWSNLDSMLKGGEGESSRLEEALLESDDAGRAVMDELGFQHPERGDMIRNKFFRSLVETPDTFDGPRADVKPGEKGTRIPADRALVQQAFDETGAHDPIGFAARLHELSGGEGHRTQFILDTIKRLNQRFKEADGMYSKFEPSDIAEGKYAIRGMVPDALIDARTIEHLPAKWFDYHDYDRRESAMMAQRIAANRAFGRNAEGLAGDADQIAKEVSDAKSRLRLAVEAAKEEQPTASAKEIDKMVKAKLGPDYDTVSKLAKRDNLVESIVRNQSTYFRKEHSDDLTMQWASRMTHTLGQLLVNRPTSALNQMEQLFGINLRYGAGGSTITGTGSALREFGSEVVKSLAQTIGVQMEDRSWTDQTWTRLNLTDPNVVRRMGDVMIRQSGETGLGQVLRGISEAPGATLNRVGEGAKHTAFTPAQPFNFVATASEVAITKALWRMVGAHIANGRKFLMDNRELLSDPNTVLDSKVMGLTGREKYTFDRLTSDLHNYNMDYTKMVRDMIERGDNQPFNDENARRLYSMALHEILSESSLTTMPSASYTDKIYRVISPLLGWAFRRGVAVLDAGRTPEGRRDLYSLANGIAGLVLLAGGGLATSAIVNSYSEDLLGKKRNLRSMTGPTADQAILGMWENLNRVGSFGLLGEGANTLFNVGTGGDNRALSADKRIVALSAINNLASAVSSFANQGGDADYVHVIRPMLEVVGGGGALQYLQLANHALGLDNPEARATARMNAKNWLMAGGRELQMDVREADGSGGYSNATPISPSLTRMELAAYGNNPVAFHEAYVQAVQRAKESGNPDPVDYVKRAFTARNPLKSVFRTAPSEAEYQRLLGALPETGSTDVRQAVNYFNAYAERIGAKAFDGKADKKEPAMTSAKGMMAMPKFGSSQDALRTRANELMFSR